MRSAGTETGNVLIVVWYGHSRRETSLAAELGGQVAFIYKRGLRHRALTPLRYLVQSVETWQLLDRAQPGVVIVQTPPIAAALPVALWCHLHRRSYGMDSHTGTFYGRRWSWALPLLRVLAGRAAVTVAASEAALRLLRSWGKRAVFLADGLPSLSPPSGTVGSAGQARLAVISSFDPDEPVPEVFAAARLLPHVTFYCSGDKRRIPASLMADKPDNLVLTGFLPDTTYSGLLQNVDGLVVLTTDPNILTCGAYEAMSVGKPAVLSDWPQMRRYFTRGFVYASNTPEGIAGGIQEMLAKRDTLAAEIVAGRSEFIARRKSDFDSLVGLLGLRAEFV